MQYLHSLVERRIRVLLQRSVCIRIQSLTHRRATEIVPRSSAAGGAPAAAVAAGGVNVADLPKEMKLHLQYQEQGLVANPLKSDDELCKEADERCAKGDNVGAEKCFASVLRRNPKHAKALCNYGWVSDVTCDCDV